MAASAPGNNPSSDGGGGRSSSSPPVALDATPLPKSALLQSTLRHLFAMIYACVLIRAWLLIVLEAYTIRLHAINEYGRIIHEFDPYFNYRATEYLHEHGWNKFKEWFDYMSWYPLGRPVGTTIYPGMQVTSVFLKEYVLKDMTLNDICCFVPAWFGAVATVMTGLLCYECSVGTYGGRSEDDEEEEERKESSGSAASTPDGAGERFGSILAEIPLVKVVYKILIVPIVNFLLRLIDELTFGFHPLPKKTPKVRTTSLSTPALESCLFASALMSIIPAHIMRSVGGGYDNESVAVTAMTTTFYFWVRSLRGGPNSKSGYFGVLTGLAYFYMVAAWGGYVFVVNLVGVHAALLVLIGRYSPKLYKAYTLFYLVGTALAVRVPVVGWTPLRSLEQIGPLLVFLGFQLIQFCEVVRIKRKLNRKGAWKLRIQAFSAAAVVGLVFLYALSTTGYFGPISSRVRGLFVKHTKTGNPLVDSVAEHQAASAQAYWQYLHHVVYVSPVGFAMVALFYFHDASSFLIVYGTAAYFFSHKMVRLILLTAPIGCALAGLALGRIWGWLLRGVTGERPSIGDLWDYLVAGDDDQVAEAEVARRNPELARKVEAKRKKDESGGAGGKKGKKGKAASAADRGPEHGEAGAKKTTDPRNVDRIKWIAARVVSAAISYALFVKAKPYAKDFYDTSHQMAKQMSHPTILFKGRTQGGDEVLVDDYREAYWWLRDNTPEDSRVMAWWDYGYQITAIANRTTIADGNTWNHEHIALLGRALTSPEKEGHRIARHLADYVLVWAGGGGDDLAKSPHLARIANSVYRDMCPHDPTCRSFGFIAQGRPSPMMGASLLYKLHSHGYQPGVEADKNRFKNVYNSKHGKVRIYKVMSVSKESKAWVADPANRICDVEGGWFCRGQYPPALRKVLKQKKDFAQLEDFNRGESDEEYQKKYFEHLNDPKKAARARVKAEQAAAAAASEDGQVKINLRKLPQDQINRIGDTWENNERTTEMWKLISKNDISGLAEWLSVDPAAAYIRSEDGRGPMWWAYEFGRKEIVAMLKNVGVSETDLDEGGTSAFEMRKKRKR